MINTESVFPGRAGADAGTRTRTYRLQDSPSTTTTASTSDFTLYSDRFVTTAAPVDVSSRHISCHAVRTGAVIFRWIRSATTARIASVPAQGQRQKSALCAGR